MPNTTRKSKDECLKIIAEQHRQKAAWSLRKELTRKYQNNYFLIVQDPKSNLILLQQLEKKWQLPCFKQYGRKMYGLQYPSRWVHDACEQLRWSFEITLLRCLWYKEYIDEDHLRLKQAILVMELQGDCAMLSEDMRWMDPSRLSLNPGVQDAMDVIRQFQIECSIGQQPVVRPAFSRCGWYQAALSWMKAQLVAKGLGSIVQIEQVKCSNTGTVFRARVTNGEMVFLKATPSFVNEAHIHQVLSSIAPQYVLPPLAVDINRRLLLMRDFGETCSVMFLFNREERKNLAKDIFEMQMCTVGKEAELESCGIKMIRLSCFEPELDKVLTYCEEHGVAERSVANVRQVCPQIMNDCRRLESLGLPNTLVHGDIHQGNVAQPVEEGGPYRFFDWSLSFISHPFLGCPWAAYEAYQDYWLSFLFDTFPKSARSDLLEEAKECLFIGFEKLSKVHEAIREFYLIDQMERQNPEAYDEMGSCLMRLAKSYSSDEKVVGWHLENGMMFKQLIC